MNKIIIAVISPPGGGKSTILKQLSEEYGIPVISTGDIARAMKNEIVTDFDQRGTLAPEEEMRTRLKKAIDEAFKKHDILLADGFPRFVGQYEWLINSFAYANVQLYHLDTPLDIARQRLLDRGRNDDNIHTINERYKTYHELTEPIISTYGVHSFTQANLIKFLKQSITKHIS